MPSEQPDLGSAYTKGFVHVGNVSLVSCIDTQKVDYPSILITLLF